MDLTRILTFGDGYAANHIWPEWPAIVAALYPDLAHENFGAVGAGDEFITTAIVECHKRWPDAFFIVQWGHEQRFDKLIQDDSWNAVIDGDPVYHFNRVSLFEQTWWLSSKSDQDLVRRYHNIYVQNRQSHKRSLNYKYLVEHLLRSRSLFFDLRQMHRYSYSKRFAAVRQEQVQPSPIVHMSWVEENILPHMPYQPEKTWLAELRQRIQRHSWQAYDPDREEIWSRMSRY